MGFRIGFGYDVHRLEEGYELVIGGLKVPHTKGAVGHSDADVLIHAICDAILGAMAMRDIGFHFPDNNAEYKGIDSKILLQKVMLMAKNNNFKINNIDTTICLQTPKISSHIEQMRKVLAPILNVSVDDISIKATTTEKLSFIGEEKGISAYAVVLLEK